MKTHERECRMQNAECRMRNVVSRNAQHVEPPQCCHGGGATRLMPHARRTAQAFTMIEIAISLAVIGFALVAILGVLPIGMNVQKENREETVINQDASVFMNAIRNGARGMDDLTNYVMAITNSGAQFLSNGKVKSKFLYWYTQTNSSVPGFALTNGFRIVGLLSTPKYMPTIAPNGTYNGFYSNYVVASIRSLSGPANEKFPQNNADLQDLAFGYRMISDVVPFGFSYDNFNKAWVNVMSRNMQNNLHEVRLTFRWPLAKGTNAPGRQVFRTLAGGSLQETNEPGFLRPIASQPSPYDLYYFEPRTYVQAQTP
jgi:type II secretory pathway pseudopilin PulG